MSDSEYDSEITVVAAPVPQPDKKPKVRKTSSKRKIAPVANATALARRPELPTTLESQDEALQCSKKRKVDIFSLLKAEERASLFAANSSGGGGNVTTSFFTSRVSGGQSRRTVPVHEGDFYVELKLYNVADVQNTPTMERYKKALTTLKLRISKTGREWETLQEFLVTTYKLFKNTTPIMFSDKTHFN